LQRGDGNDLFTDPAYGRKVYAQGEGAGQQPEDLGRDTEALTPSVYRYHMVVDKQVFTGKLLRE
jgi:hypothetical protein